MRRLPSFWRDDKGLSALLLTLVATLFVAPPLVVSGMLGPIVLDGVFSLVLISGVAALSHRRLLKVLATILAVLAVATRAWTIFSSSPAVAQASRWLALISLLVLTVLTLVQVFRAGPITRHRIGGAVAAYLLLGLTWSTAYEIVLARIPDALRLPANENHLLGVVYFSFVTLTTVGYGDITPVAPIARSLATSEALVGQLFPAILIARLVSMEISGRERHRIESEDAPKK